MSNNTNPVVKKTLVSVTVHGRRCSYFLDLEYVRGRAVLPASVLNNLPVMRGVSRGVTYSIG